MLGLAELVFISALFGVPLFIIALVSVLRAEFSGNDKLVWILVIIFLPVLGPILYFIIGRRQRVGTKKA
jgi:heme/copper-type cytochrome/quinol oxidase subunit 2